MHKPINLIIAGLALGVGLSACGRDRHDRVADTTVVTPGTTTQPDTTVSSSDLENAVKAKFQTDDQLRAANINVNADPGKKEITLSGTVPSQELRSHAVDLAKSTGKTVNDKIDDKPAA